MTETQFTRAVVIPLLTALYPESFIEETHGSNEAGRDVICRTSHPILSRDLVLCVQVKNHRLSTGSTTGPYSMAAVLNQIRTAKTVGVCGADGVKLQPDEVWLVNPHVFSEPQRREVQDFLIQLKDFNAHMIVGTELSSLLQKNCPTLVSQLSRWANTKLAQAIASLSVHHESRAFGLRTDRLIGDFHVSARVCPSTTLTTDLLAAAIELTPYNVAIKWEAKGAEADALALHGSRIDSSDLDREPTLAKFAPLVGRYRIPTALMTRIDRQSSVRLTRTYVFDVSQAKAPTALKIANQLGDANSVEVTWTAPIDEAIGMPADGVGIQRSDLDRNQTLANLAEIPSLKGDRLVTWSLVQSAALGPEEDACLVTRTYKFDLPGTATRIRDDLRSAFRKMPKKVGKDPKTVARLIRSVADIEGFLTTCQDLRVTRSTNVEETFHRPDLLLEDESELVALAPRLMIEGEPGLGKTTLLRRLAVTLLKRNEPVFYVPCAQVTVADQARSLAAIARRLAVPGTPRIWNPEKSLLLVDGLDEAPFDMTTCIGGGHGSVIVSVRRAFETALRTQFGRLELSPFTPSDRDAFFARWFAREPSQEEKARKLISQHLDLDLHTRVPLLATIVAALIERGFSPTTRNAIYNDRLELLLGRWDHARGVNRSYAPADDKMRFLEVLAHMVHSMPGRRRRFSRGLFGEAFAEGMGLRGRNLNLEKVIDDLVVASGVLVREGDEFSFGHLTYQEHLVARRLKRLGRPGLVLNLLDSDWWREVLLFYAGEVGDITELVELYEKQAIPPSGHALLLRKMVEHAPYTQQVAVEILDERIRDAKESLARERDSGVDYEAESIEEDLASWDSEGATNYTNQGRKEGKDEKDEGEHEEKEEEDGPAT
jgi:DNA polymerase III delta prime subunit